MNLINDEGLNLIKDFEGCRLNSYKCPAGIWTIGYGATGEDIKDGLKWTNTQACERLEDDIKRFEEGLNKLLSVPVNSNQYSALVCFVYNVGLKAFETSRLRRCVNDRQFELAAEEFIRWNKVKLQVVDGLTRRRLAEKALFKKEVVHI